MGLSPLHVMPAVSDHDRWARTGMAGLAQSVQGFGYHQLFGRPPSVQFAAADNGKETVQAKMFQNPCGINLRLGGRDRQNKSLFLKGCQKLPDPRIKTVLKNPFFDEVFPVGGNDLFRLIRRHPHMFLHRIADGRADKVIQGFVGRNGESQLPESETERVEDPLPGVGQGPVQVKEQCGLGGIHTVVLYPKERCRGESPAGDCPELAVFSPAGRALQPVPFSPRPRHGMLTAMINFDWTGSDGVVAGGPGGWLDPQKDQNAIRALYRPSVFRFEPGTEFPAGSCCFLGDNLPVLSSLRDVYRGKIRLIYIDPPYNTGRNVFGYPDRFEPEIWLTFMKNRLELARELLTPDGSLFLHLDHNASHYGRMLLDNLFGPERFVNEIIWCYHGPGTPKQKRFSRKHDTLLWYAAGENWIFNRDDVRLPSTIHPGGFHNQLDKKLGSDYMTRGKIPEDWWNLAVAARFRVDGVRRTGYLTEKPLKLLDRIIRTASCPRDYVLDFFAGSGIAGYAAAGLDRQFLLVEQRPEAMALIRSRLEGIPHSFAEIEEVGGYQPGVCDRNDLFYLRKPVS